MEMTHEEIRNILGEVKLYFQSCLVNASRGSSARARFKKYMDAMDNARDELKVLEQMEDDGK